MSRLTFRDNGYITLFSILIISAIAITLTLSILALGAASSKTGITFGQAKQANSLAHYCAEEALEQIKNNAALTGTTNLTVGSNSCSYTIVNDGGQNRTVNTSGTVSEVTRRVKLSLTAVSPNITVASWREVDNF